MPQSFSDRHGYEAPEREISVRDDAPAELRDAVVQLGAQAGMSYSALRDVVCEELLVRPDPDNWTEIPNVRDEVFWRLERCDWFKVYDIAEAIYAHLSNSREPLHVWDNGSAQALSDRLNRFFLAHGIGWQMDQGHIRHRGPESQAIKRGRDALSSTGRSGAAGDLDEAWKCISRRPEPNIKGAANHAMLALEATARDVTGQPDLTLGKLVRHLELKPPLDKALEKLWGYASNQARHGLEGSKLTAAEAELMVGISGAVCGFLANLK